MLGILSNVFKTATFMGSRGDSPKHYDARLHEKLRGEELRRRRDDHARMYRQNFYF